MLMNLTTIMFINLLSQRIATGGERGKTASSVGRIDYGLFFFVCYYSICSPSTSVKGRAAFFHSKGSPFPGMHDFYPPFSIINNILQFADATAPCTELGMLDGGEPLASFDDECKFAQNGGLQLESWRRVRIDPSSHPIFFPLPLIRSEVHAVVSLFLRNVVFSRDCLPAVWFTCRTHTKYAGGKFEGKWFFSTVIYLLYRGVFMLEVIRAFCFCFPGFLRSARGVAWPGINYSWHGRLWVYTLWHIRKNWMLYKGCFCHPCCLRSVSIARFFDKSVLFAHQG